MYFSINNLVLLTVKKLQIKIHTNTLESSRNSVIAPVKHSKIE